MPKFQAAPKPFEAEDPKKAFKAFMGNLRAVVSVPKECVYQSIADEQAEKKRAEKGQGNG